jgi:hypothetical protein
MNTTFLSENPKVADNMGDPGVGMDNIQMQLKETKCQGAD